MRERLFLLDCDNEVDGQIYRERHVVTEEQLMEELNIDSDPGSLDEPVRVQHEDYIITVSEAKSLEEVKAFMTWEGEKDGLFNNPDNDDLKYPDFVPDELRNGRLVGLSGETDKHLPISGDYNPTISEYMVHLDIPKNELGIYATFTPKEKAIHAIAQTVYDEDGISLEDYNDILKEYNLDEYVIDSDIQQMKEDLAVGLESFSGADPALTQ